jgi:hypothetical protein
MYRIAFLAVLMLTLSCSKDIKPTAPDEIPFRATDLTVGATSWQGDHWSGSEWAYSVTGTVKNNSARTLNVVTVLIQYKVKGIVRANETANVDPIILAPGVTGAFEGWEVMNVGENYRDMDSFTIQPSCTLGAGQAHSASINWN